MKSRSIFHSITFAFSTVLVALISCTLNMPDALSQASDKTPDSERPAIQISGNLVVVRVVVRDSKGNPIEGLKKDDFKLFDRGKEQTIAQFEEHPSSSTTNAGQAATAALPENFFILYFDDLYTYESDLMQARAAAEKYLATHIQPSDRVAIFTSTAMLSDFTSDPQQIHDALQKLRASPRGLTRFANCPQLSDYQASEIARTIQYDPTNDAWKVAMNDAYLCSQNISAPEPIVEASVRAEARQIEDQARTLTQSNMDGLEQAVAAISQMPGRRSVILVSPGFMSDSVQVQVNRIVDHALQSQVIVNSLDPKGLVLNMREADASQRNLPTGDQGPAADSIDTTRELIAGGVLYEIAQGTGGEYVHNENDLKAGFARLSGSPSYYTLAFSPTDLKQDGQFHALKVTLAESRKGITVQARKGYFAAANQPESADAGLPTAPAASPNVVSPSPSASDPAIHEQIRDALFAKKDTSQLVVALDTKIAAGQGGMSDLSLSSHLGGKDLPFRKDAGNNTNTVIFVFAVFDSKGNLLSPQQMHVDLEVPDAEMPAFLQAGVNEDATFELKPGNYRIREVVIDAEQHHLTSLSRSVKIP
jgi:VWFA-related protein